MNKQCPRCGSNFVFDDGTELGVHEWSCTVCGERWYTGALPLNNKYQAEIDYGTLELVNEKKEVA